MVNETYVGIDLGSSKISISYHDATAQVTTILKTDTGLSAEPAFLTFHSGRRSFGATSRDLYSVYPSETVTIGDLKSIRDDTPLAYRSLQVKKENGEFAIGITIGNFVEYFYIDELLSMFLLKARQLIEKRFNVVCNTCVVTFPSCLNTQQRNYIEIACHVVGFTKETLLRDTAAISCALVTRLDEVYMENLVMIVDIGSTTTKTAISQVTKAQVQVLVIASECNLGGDTLTGHLVEHFVDVIRKQHNLDISNDARNIALLFAACDVLRVDLSTNESKRMPITLINGPTIELEMTKTAFERLAERTFSGFRNVYAKLFEKLSRRLHNNKIPTKSDITTCVLAGGVTHTPRIKNDLRQLLGNDITLNESVHIDEIVSIGAAEYHNFRNNMIDVSIEPKTQAFMRTQSDIDTIRDSLLLFEHKDGNINIYDDLKLELNNKLKTYGEEIKSMRKITEETRKRVLDEIDSINDWLQSESLTVKLLQNKIKAFTEFYEAALKDDAYYETQSSFTSGTPSIGEEVSAEGAMDGDGDTVRSEIVYEHLLAQDIADMQTQATAQSEVAVDEDTSTLLRKHGYALYDKISGDENRSVQQIQENIKLVDALFTRIKKVPDKLPDIILLLKLLEQNAILYFRVNDNKSALENVEVALRMLDQNPQLRNPRYLLLDRIESYIKLVNVNTLEDADIRGRHKVILDIVSTPRTFSLCSLSPEDFW